MAINQYGTQGTHLKAGGMCHFFLISPTLAGCSGCVSVLSPISSVLCNRDRNSEADVDSARGIFCVGSEQRRENYAKF